MPTRKQIRPDEKLPLKLTAAEQKLVLEGLTCLDQEIEQIVRDTPTGQPVLMTLDDLDDFGGYVAAEANHCKDKSKAKKLDTIFEKIQGLLDKFTDEEPPKTVKIEDARKEKLPIRRCRSLSSLPRPSLLPSSWGSRRRRWNTSRWPQHSGKS